MSQRQMSREQSLKEILSHISQAREQQDQSREQQSIAMFEETEYFPVKEDDRKMPKKSLIGVKSPKKDSLILGDYCRKQAYSKWQAKKDDELIKELKQINQKLLEDNKALMRECMRLRKLVNPNISGQNGRKGNSYSKQQLLELRIIDQNKEIMELHRQNDIIRKQNSCLKKEKNISEERSKEIQEISGLRIQNFRLLKKIEELEKNNKFSGINSTMMSSKSSDWEADRVITNMKIVYEKQIKSQEQELKECKNEINRLNRAVSNSKRQHQSPMVKKFSYNEGNSR